MMQRRLAGARRAAGRTLALAVAMGAIAAMSGCAGGVPRVPATPEAVLERADDYYRRGRNVQAVALYEKFLERYVGHERADYAQFRLADSYLKGEQYELAAVEFQVLITNYGYSEWVDDALFSIGVCYWRQAPRAARDQQKTTDALSRFNQYLQTYPDGPHVPEARQYIKAINARLAEKALDSAHWYYRRHEAKAALVYCDKVIDNYPENQYWVEAVYLKGMILLDRGQNEEAIAQFTRVLEYPEKMSLKHDAEVQIKRARE